MLLEIIFLCDDVLKGQKFVELLLITGYYCYYS